MIDRQRRRPSRRTVVLSAFGALALLVALLGFVYYYWPPGSVVTLALSAASPYLVLAAIVSGVLFGLLRGPTGWAGLAASVVLLGWGIAVQVPAFVASTAPPGRDIVVLTANLCLGTATPAAVVDLVRAHHVDVLMLEELTPAENTALDAAGLRALLPYQRLALGYNAAGTGLLSRFPISHSAVRTDFGFGFVDARVAVPGIAPAPTMVALHMFGPYPGRQTPRWTADMSQLRPVLQGLPSDAPVVVGGDFNATTSMAQFRRLLTGGYADAVDQAGAGFTPTYPANRLIPLIAIDHVLTRGAVARSVDALRLPGSDHRALLVTVRLPAST